MQSYYISILQSRNSINKKARTRSRKTENIWFFRILIDLILWQNLVRIEKLEFALFTSTHFFFIDFSIIFSSLTYHVNFLQSNHIDIESLMSQEIFENSEIHNDAIRSWCDLHSRQYRTTQTIDICFMMYRLFNFRYQFSHRCFVSWRFRTRSQFFRCSIARFTIRFYVIFEVNRLSNFDSFVFAVFASMYDLVLQNLRHWRNSRMRIVERITSLKKFQNSSSKKFKRKLQTEFVKIQSRWHKRLLWKSIEIQFSQMCCADVAIRIQLI